MKKGPGARVIQVILLFTAVGAAGYWPAFRWWADAGVSAMITAGLVCLGAGLLSLIPMELASRKDQTALMHAWLIGTMMRLLITIASAFVVYYLTKPNRTAYAFWLIIFYLVFLFWDVWTAVRLIRNMKAEKN